VLVRSTTQIGVSRDEMDRMGQSAMRMGDTGRGPQELGEALFYAQSAGLRGAEALDVVEQSARASAIGLGDTATITDLTTSAINAYGAENLNAAQAGDILVGTVREGKASADELTGAMGQVLPIASNMGISLDQVGGAMAAMTRTGTSASESSTQLRAIMVSLLKPAEQSEEALAQFGLSAEGLRDTIREDGLHAALMQVREAVGDNDEAMARIFPNVRALSGVMDLTGESADTTAGIFERMTDTTGLLSEGFEEWSQTTEASQQRFSASMESARIALGDGLGPAMRAVLDLGTGLADTFVSLPGPVQTFVGVGGGAVGVAGALAGSFLVLTPRILATKDAIATLGGVSGAARTGMSGLLKFGLHPVTIALGVGAIAVGAYAKSKAEARQRAEEFKATLDAETGAITANSREYVVAEASRDGLIDKARSLGIEVSTPYGRDDGGGGRATGRGRGDP